MGILNQDFYCQKYILVLFLPFFINLYTDIQTKLPFIIVLLTKTDKTTHQVSCQHLLNHMVTIMQACPSSEDHLEDLSSVSPAVPWTIPQFCLSHRAGTSPSPSCELLAQQFCCRPVADIHFLSVSRRNVTKRRVQSLFLSVMFFDKWLTSLTEMRQSWWHCFPFF